MPPVISIVTSRGAPKRRNCGTVGAFITPIIMVYGTYNYSIHGVYKPNWGGPPCSIHGAKKRTNTPGAALCRRMFQAPGLT